LNIFFRGISVVGELGRMSARSFSSFLRSLFRYFLLVYQTAIRMPLLLKNPDLTISHMYTLGIESLPLVTIIGLFLGSEVVIQGVYQMTGIIPMRYLGVLVCKGITIELGPVITSMVVAGRVATGIAAEIGSMKTSEQLDAMQVLSLDSIRYLIVPKVAACIIMLPVLTVWGELMAFSGAIINTILSVDITMQSFLDGLQLFFNAKDLIVGVLKTSVFGIIIAITGAHCGLEARSGAEGVGEATTKAVVTTAVLILIFDFIIGVLVL
jgi:phospholipid/cholesterol/gamma-HCH transport system permease protein